MKRKKKNKSPPALTTDCGKNTVINEPIYIHVNHAE